MYIKIFFLRDETSKEMLMTLLTFHPSSTNESPSMILMSDSDGAKATVLECFMTLISACDDALCR